MSNYDELLARVQYAHAYGQKDRLHDDLLAALRESENARQTAEERNAWDGEWRTIPQTQEESRHVLMTWTKKELVDFHIAAWQRELQRDEFWRSNMLGRTEHAEAERDALQQRINAALAECEAIDSETSEPLQSYLASLVRAALSGSRGARDNEQDGERS